MAKVRSTEVAPFGARIHLDLTASVSDAQIRELQHLFNERHLLVFPGQILTHPRQVEVSGWFGPVEDAEKLSVLANEPSLGGLGDAELAFHSDLSCATEPLQGLSLYALDVDALAPPTQFVNAVSVAKMLPPVLRERLAELHVMNLWPRSLNVRQRRADAPTAWPGTAHPVLKPHPRTGELILYLNASHSDRIVELSEQASEELIRELFEYLYIQSERYVHHWRNGDFVVWDNLALQHARDPVPTGAKRTLRRVEIGSRSYVREAPGLHYAPM